MSDHPSLATPYRTHTCGELRATDAGAEVRLSGWVHRRRDHGQLIFLDLRDRHGLTQVVIDKADAPAAQEEASRVRSEFVVAVRGTVALRLPGTENAKLPTGAIEVQATEVEILSEAKTPPFYINDPDAPIDEAIRLKYRYLDIRREPMQQRLLLRSRMVQSIREIHHRHGFIEVETPTLIKSTPEGARDFIVPSRLQPGSVYALPQSPQQLKQLLMVAGIDRYFQIARCYRDEDLRGDRQPEFTQLDLEMSFVDEATVMAFVEAMAIEVSAATTPERPLLQVPFPVLTFEEAIERYGSDKPDIRFGMELVDLAPALAGPDGQGASGFVVFDSALAGGRTGQGDRGAGDGRDHPPRDRRAHRAGQALRGEGPGLSRARSRRDDQEPHRQVPLGRDPARHRRADRRLRRRPHPHRRRHPRRHRRRPRPPARGARVAGSSSPIRRSSPTSGSTASRCTTGTRRASAGTPPTTRSAACCRRTRCCSRPRPATRPYPSRDDPAGHARALQYDLALNGWELGGGSIRIHRRELLETSFRLQGQTIEGMQEKFGAVLDAFEYGAPPHGGIALGIDRWAMIFAGQTNIREVMAFPKTQSGTDPMLDAPSVPEPGQYDELGLRFVGLPERPS